jgi:hypothetical protein
LDNAEKNRSRRRPKSPLRIEEHGGHHRNPWLMQKRAHSKPKLRLLAIAWPHGSGTTKMSTRKLHLREAQGTLFASREGHD